MGLSGTPPHWETPPHALIWEKLSPCVDYVAASKLCLLVVHPIQIFLCRGTLSLLDVLCKTSLLKNSACLVLHRSRRPSDSLLHHSPLHLPCCQGGSTQYPPLDVSRRESDASSFVTPKLQVVQVTFPSVPLSISQFHLSWLGGDRAKKKWIALQRHLPISFPILIYVPWILSVISYGLEVAYEVVQQVLCHQLCKLFTNDLTYLFFHMEATCIYWLWSCVLSWYSRRERVSF